MKKIIGFITFAVLLIIIFAGYYFNFSYHAVIHDAGFKRQDLVKSIEYPSEEGMYKLLLLEDTEKIGVILLKRKNNFIWCLALAHETDRSDSIDSFAITAMTIYQDWDFPSPTNHKHIFLATYYDPDLNSLEYENPDDFILNYELLTHNNEKLLFIHAISDDLESFGSDDVISFLKNN